MTKAQLKQQVRELTDQFAQTTLERDHLAERLEGAIARYRANAVALPKSQPCNRAGALRKAHRARLGGQD